MWKNTKWEVHTDFRHVVAPKDLMKNRPSPEAWRRKNKNKKECKNTHKFELWPSPHWLAANFLNFTQAVYPTDHMVIAKLLNDHKLQPWGKYSWKLTSHLILNHISSQRFVYQKVLELAPKLFNSWQMHWPLSKELGSNLCFMLVRGSSSVAGGLARGWGILLKEEKQEG